MKNMRLINVVDYATAVLKHLASTAVTPRLPRWRPQQLPQHRGTDQLRLHRGLRRTRRGSTPSPPADPLPTTSPPLPGPRCDRRARLCHAEPLPGGLPLPRVPRGRSGGLLAGTWARERVGESGGGSRERDPAGPSATADALSSPRAAAGRRLAASKPRQSRPAFLRPAQSQPPFPCGRGPAQLSPLSRGPSPAFAGGAAPAGAAAALGDGGAVSPLPQPRQVLLGLGKGGRELCQGNGKTAGSGRSHGSGA